MSSITASGGGVFIDQNPFPSVGREEIATDDVVDLIESLCSDSSSYIIGQDIVVDGGLNVQYPEGVVRDIVTQNL